MSTLSLIRTWPRRLLWSCLSFVVTFFLIGFVSANRDPAAFEQLTENELMTRVLGIPAVVALLVMVLLQGCADIAKNPPTGDVKAAVVAAGPNRTFTAQVICLVWLNPLARKDYPTEWQLLWALGLVKPNKNDDMVRTMPKLFSTLQPVSPVAYGNGGSETFKGFHHKYVEELNILFRHSYFTDPHYFYSVQSDDKSTWRELAGIHVEYALPARRLDPKEAADFLKHDLMGVYDIGNKSFPTLWTKDTPPDVNVTQGGPNVGFTSLAAGLDYLKTHPQESVWVMGWDAPSFPPNDKQLNENMVLLILAGPDFRTGRAPLAWLGYPASAAIDDFEAKSGEPSRLVQAWKAAFAAAAKNVDQPESSTGYVIHDAGQGSAESSARIGPLAQSLTESLPEFDFLKQTFNTAALLGDMGAGSALTNVALGIGYAHHLGGNVLIAGTTDAGHPTALLVKAPAVVRPIQPDKDWFRARGGNNAWLPWWGRRLDDKSATQQGYSD